MTISTATADSKLSTRALPPLIGTVSYTLWIKEIYYIQKDSDKLPFFFIDPRQLYQLGFPFVRIISFSGEEWE